jgi:hypothetical protein
MEDINYSNGVDWARFNDRPPSVRWWLNTLNCSRPLLVSCEPGDHEKAAFLIEDWWRANKPGSPASDFAWDGHATAYRAEQIACLRTKMEAGWLEDAGRQHGKFLAAPANHQGSWNHGLDQDIGLLSLGYAFGRREWVELARERATKAISVMVDWQGVSIEQAISYHFYNFVRFADAREMFATASAPLPVSVFDRVDLMPEFLAHATRPDGNWVCLGDSVNNGHRRDMLQATEAEYALSRGTAGPRPKRRFGIFHSGYIFGRTGWGEARPFDREGYYSIRFGPGRIIHGHNDHTSITYYSRGRDILIDGGFDGYTPGKWRDHLRSPRAHNLVYTTDRERFHWDRETKLTDLRIQRTWQSYRLADVPYPSTERIRSVLFLQEPLEAIVVLDRVQGPERRYEQAWHFDDALAVSTEDGQATAEGGNLRIIVRQMWPFDSMRVVRGQEEPVQGWAGHGPFKRRPTPVLLTARKAKAATFLTVVLVLDQDAEPARVAQRPIAGSTGTIRELTLQSDAASLTVEISSDGLLSLARP